jgi:hypothetical protein
LRFQANPVKNYQRLISTNKSGSGEEYEGEIDRRIMAQGQRGQKHKTTSEK